MPLLEIFRKDRKHWTHDQIQQIQLFFLLSPFFSPQYEHQDFEEVVNLIFYSQISPEHDLELNLNRKSDAVILLQGHIEWFRAAQGRQLKKNKKSQKEAPPDNYVKIGECMNPLELIELKSDVLVKSKENISEIIYVPTILYDSYARKIKERRLATVLQVLNNLFKEVPKYELRELAQKDCKFRQLRMNHHFYRAGEKSCFCYIVIDGNVRIESPGFQHQKALQMVILGQNSLFGHLDSFENIRTQNAVCCSAHCKVLEISLESYHRLLMRNQHMNHAFAQQLNELAKSKVQRSQKQKYSLPRIQRFHSFVKPAQEQKIEKNLIQHCHMLISLSPRKKTGLSFRLPEHLQKDYSVNQFQQKLKLFKRRQKPDSSLDLTNKLI